MPPTRESCKDVSSVVTHGSIVDSLGKTSFQNGDVDQLGGHLCDRADCFECRRPGCGVKKYEENAGFARLRPICADS
jgi:hypothetical protein